MQTRQVNPHTFDIAARSFVTHFQDHNDLHSRARREAADVEIPEELLMVQSIRISDKFGFRGAQTQSRDSAANNLKESSTIVSVCCFCLLIP